MVNVNRENSITSILIQSSERNSGFKHSSVKFSSIQDIVARIILILLIYLLDFQHDISGVKPSPQNRLPCFISIGLPGDLFA